MSWNWSKDTLVLRVFNKCIGVRTKYNCFWSYSAYDCANIPWKFDFMDEFAKILQRIAVWNISHILAYREQHCEAHAVKNLIPNHLFLSRFLPFSASIIEKTTYLHFVWPRNPFTMARNAEKAMTTLARWRASQIEEPIRKKRRPFFANDCNDLRDAQRWRLDIIREISRKVTQIQNAGLGEHRIRDLNDQINKLLREKKHWEIRIKELGGTDIK